MRGIYKQLNPIVRGLLKNIKLIALDFDGVLTTNSVIHEQDGTEKVQRTRADSFGIDLLDQAGLYDKENYENNSKEIDIIILSRETNPIVAGVAKKIKIKCSKGIYNKIGRFDEEVKKRNLSHSEVLFIGNDLNDLECIKKAGIGVAVADSWPQIKEAANYITTKKGGHGAFREMCELVLYAKEAHPHP